MSYAIMNDIVYIRSYENCRRPGVAILDMQMSKVPIISGYVTNEKSKSTFTRQLLRPLTWALLLVLFKTYMMVKISTNQIAENRQT